MPQTVNNAAATEQITKDVWAIVDRLPQRDAIKEGDARHWVREVVAQHGDLAKWHATRAGGFGGSQIGALVRNFHGQRADHSQSARKIVAGALLMEIPEESTAPMRRGVAMEASHRDWFMKKYGAHRDVKGFQTLSKSTGQRPWMRYSPDELAFMPNPSSSAEGGLERWLGDYKAPTEVDRSDKVAFQYVCQLHMGRLVCEHNGVHIDGMILSQFDWQNWALKDDVIPYIPELDQMILQAGDHYWEYVLRGDLPQYVRKSRLEEAKGLVDEISDDAFRLARLSALAKIFEDESKKLKEKVVAAASRYRFGASSLSVAGSLKISAVQVFDQAKVAEAAPEDVLASVPLMKSSSKRYDEDKLRERVKATLAPGEKMNQFYAVGNLDSMALYSALCDAGIDADSLMGEQLRVSTDPNVTKDVQAFVKREFSDLFSETESEAEEASSENREGQQEPRHVPRFQSA